MKKESWLEQIDSNVTVQIVHVHVQVNAQSMTKSKANKYQGKWESRWHPLRQEWVIMASHRQDRPWLGSMSDVTKTVVPRYDASCYLCPGNTRVNGSVNDTYKGVYVFDNDHPCVSDSAPVDLEKPTGIYRNRPATGISRVICFSEKHNYTLAQMTTHEIAALVQVWQGEYKTLGDVPEISNVLIFENKGEVSGVSNPHPHGQIYATNFVFNTIAVEVDASRKHFDKTGRYLFEDIIEAELEDSARVIVQDEHAIAFIPYFGRYAYEVYVAPKRRVSNIAELTSVEVDSLSEILSQIAIRFDNLWEMSFPYLSVLHNAPTDGQDYSTYHFHIQFHPPLRKPNVLKYLAGPEIGGGNFLSDTNPDEKAAELKALSGIHYLSRT